MSHSQDKVVSIASGGNADAFSAARMPLSLRKLQDKARQGLMGLLQTMFDNTDDALFALADKARSNIEQNIFFESMREVRLKRRTIEAEFAQLLPAMFEQAYIGEPLADPNGGHEQNTVGGLSLVQNDELEAQVAIDGMIAKGLANNSVELRQLTQRIDSLIKTQVIDEQSNPLGPRVICESFMQACAGLDVEIKSKLVVFKLFDKYVVSHLGSLYHACNQLLISEGVLPGLQLEECQKRQGATQPARSGQAANADDFDSTSSEEMFASLQSLLAQQQHVLLANKLLHSANWFQPGLAPELPTPQVMDLLGDVQHLQEQSPATVPVQHSELQPVDVHTQLRKLLEERNVKERQSLGRVDFDAINLVALLFQFILDDPNVATPMKALIGRLQIPILKVAMLDKSFFNKGGHPARKLLNKIATSALGWTPSEDKNDDPLLQKIDSVVQRVLSDFDEDVSLFEEVLGDYEAFISTERKRAGLIEKRTVNAEDGRARADEARQLVQVALNEKVAGRRLPSVVLQLLQEAWSNVLFLACLKEGVDSENWGSALATVDDLLWSVADHEGETARSELLQLLPGLLKSLRNGLTQISYDSFKMNELFSQLEYIHLKKLRAAADSAVATDDGKNLPAPKPDTSQSTSSADTRQALKEESGELQQDAMNDLLSSIDAVISNGTATNEQTTPHENTAVKPSAAAMPEPLAADAELVVEKIVLAPTAGKHEDLQLESHELLAEDNEFYIKAGQLQVGAWVEMRQGNEKKFRAKLAAITKPTLKYIFVNRAGMKVSERSIMGLAVELQRRTIVLLDDSALFDRALQSVIGNLRSFKKVATT